MSDAAYEVATVDRLLAALNNGDDNAAATRLYRDIVERLADMLQEFGGMHRAQLVLTFDFAGDARGVDVALALKAKLPVRPVFKERFFVSDKNDRLTLQDPARDTLFAGDDLGRRRRATPTD